MEKTSSRFAILLLLIASFCMSSPSFAAAEMPAHAEMKKPDKGPLAGRLPLDSKGNLQISEEDRCPVCAMHPIKHPKFASAIRLTDGTTYYFCGTGCMIKSWMHPEPYLGVSEERLDRPVVREYFSGAAVDARKVKWVAGSDIVGPMGPALVPVRGGKELEVFQRRHGGTAVFTLEEMNAAKWKKITGRKSLPD